MNKFVIYTTATYGVLLLFVGIASFWRFGGYIALGIGIGGGTLILGTMIYGIKKNTINALLFIAAISLMLATYFGITFAKDNEFLPTGFMLLLSSITFAIVGFSWLDNRELSQIEEEEYEAEDTNGNSKPKPETEKKEENIQKT